MNLRKKLKEVSEDPELSDLELIDTVRIELKSWEEYLHQHVELKNLKESTFDLMQNCPSVSAIQTGWERFDKEIGGFVPGEFVVVGGRPAMGKTSLLVDLATRLSERFQILYISLDLSIPVLTSRFLARVTTVDSQHILKGNIEENERKKLELFAASNVADNIHLTDCHVHSMTELKSMCQRLVDEKKVKVILLDYLQLLSSHRYRHHRESEIAYFSRTLKEIARETNTVLICTSQLSRAVETRGGDRRPILSDLRESGAIEQDADKVLFLYRPEYYGFTMDEDGESTYGRMELIVAKNRMGPLTTIRFHMDISSCRVEDYNTSFSYLRIDSDRLNESGLDEEKEPPF
jgi:replicative DNA helicase